MTLLIEWTLYWSTLNNLHIVTHMKAKFKEHFGDNIIQTEINGKPNVVTFRHKAEIILHEF